MDLYEDEYKTIEKRAAVLYKNDLQKVKIFKNDRKLNPLTDPNLPTIPEFFENQNVFITGGSGFMGKVLIEKLLRSCSGVNKIYLLLRTKKGFDPQSRVEKLFEEPIYDRLKQENPETLAKVQAMSGDCEEINLGLSEENRNLLIENTNIVFHVAASVRFDDPLKKAVLMNVRSTREVVRLLKQMKQLKVFVHTSTAYCHTDKPVMDEIVYPRQADWRKIIHMAESFDEDKISLLEPKILDHFPNTYTFTKSLSENLVDEECKNIPTVIFRPSIVIGSLKEPVPGWIDNLNGPAGLFVGAGVGILHVAGVHPNIIVDYLPVDKAINSMIACAWYHAHNDNEKHSRSLVINACTSNVVAYTYKTFSDLLIRLCRVYPFNRRVWYPFVFATNNKFIFYVSFILLHLLPGMLLEYLSRITGNHFRLMKMYRKIYVANQALGYFTMNEWIFKNGNFLSLGGTLKKPDKDTFNMDVDSLQNVDHLRNGLFGFKQFLLKEDINFAVTLPKSRKNLQRFFVAHCVVAFFYCMIGLFLILQIPSFTSRNGYWK